MNCFEIAVIESQTSQDGINYSSDDQLYYLIPDEAEEILNPILAEYGQSPILYLEKINYGRPPASWALVCLAQKYPLAGHIVTARSSRSEISFCPYTQPPDPIPDEYMPDVGTIVLLNKRELGQTANASPLFGLIWSYLKDCSTEKRWLLIIDPLGDSLLQQIVYKNTELWRAYQFD